MTLVTRGRENSQPSSGDPVKVHETGQTATEASRRDVRDEDCADGTRRSRKALADVESLAERHSVIWFGRRRLRTDTTQAYASIRPPQLKRAVSFYEERAVKMLTSEDAR